MLVYHPFLYAIVSAVSARVRPDAIRCLSTRTAIPSVSHTPEEVDVCEFLHLINIYRLHHFLVVEKDPRFSLFPRNMLLNESHIMSGNISGQFSKIALASHRLPCVD